MTFAIHGMVTKESLFYEVQTAKHKAIMNLFKAVKEARKKEIENKRIAARKKELEGEPNIAFMFLQATLGILPQFQAQPIIHNPRISLTCNRV